MAAPIPSFETLIAHPAPAFACYACGDPTEAEALVAPVVHIAHAPAQPDDLARIPSIPGSDAARAFYASHDGALLFTARGCMAVHGGPDEGVEIFPLQEWAERTREAVETWVEAGYPDDDMPYTRDDFVAIAHVRGASTYVHWVVRGPEAGAIHWCPTTMPVQRGDRPLATTFREFIETICTQPVHFLNDLIDCYMRFSDGNTDEQWIPKRYIADRRPIP